MQSPFETLGLSPALVESLEDEALLELCKEAGKALQSIHHPDKGGDPARSRSINDSVGALSTLGAIKEQKARYIKDGPGQAEIREAEAAALRMHRMVHALDENISKTKNATRDLASTPVGGRSSRDRMNDWASALLAQDPTLIKTDGRVEEKDTLRLRHCIGARVAIGRKVMEELIIQELEELEKLHKEERQRLIENIEFERHGVDMYGNDLKKLKPGSDRHESAEIALQVCKGRILEYKRILSNREERIRKLKEELASTEPPKIIIGPQGRLLINGVKSQYFLAGMERWNDLKARENPCSWDFEDLVPGLEPGLSILAYNKGGALKRMGYIDSVYFPAADARFAGRPAERLGKRLESEVRARRADGKTDSQKTDLKKEPPAESAETGMVLRQDLHAGIAKDPFEIIGFLPSAIIGLDSDKLGILVKRFGKSLLKVLHPDRGGSKVLFSKTSAAIQILEEGNIMESAIRFIGTKTGASMISHYQGMTERSIAQIPEKTMILAGLKAEFEQTKRRIKKEAISADASMRMIFEGLFLDSDSPQAIKDSRNIFTADGMMLIVSDGIARTTYGIERHDYDVYLRSRESCFRAVGSVPPEDFSDMQDARKKLAATFPDDAFLLARPAFIPGGCLVGIHGNRLFAAGMIESIEEGKKVARKMAEKIAEKDAVQTKRGRTRSK